MEDYRRDTPLCELPLGNRALNPLLRAGFETAEELADIIRGMSLAERLDGTILSPTGRVVRGFGPGGMNAAIDALEEYGYDLDAMARRPEKPRVLAYDELEKLTAEEWLRHKEKAVAHTEDATAWALEECSTVASVSCPYCGQRISVKIGIYDSVPQVVVCGPIEDGKGCDEYFAVRVLGISVEMRVIPLDC